jgi:hypothetical protein
MEGWQCYSGELPERSNRPGISCIPAGTYTALWQLSPTHGWCYHLQAVPNRSDIEIHSANWMGDESMGYKRQLRGCIALGLGFGELDGQRAILSSRAAINEFHVKMAGEDLLLTIVGITEPAPALNGGFVGGVDA